MTRAWIAIQVAFDTDALDAIQQAYRQAPALTDRVVKRDVAPFVRHQVDKTLRREPGPVVYPIRWTPSRHPGDRGKRPNTRWGYYSRQKAAFFATNGFGAGIPYRRTHRLIRGWHVVGDYKNGFGGIKVTHDSPTSRFVFGRWQQQYHAITGWPQVASVLQVISLEANERLALAAQTVGEAIARGSTDV